MDCLFDRTEDPAASCDATDAEAICTWTDQDVRRAPSQGATMLRSLGLDRSSAHYESAQRLLASFQSARGRVIRARHGRVT